MPLTSFQQEVLALLALNRTEASHFAGGLVFNATRIADTMPDTPIGVAFVDAAGKPGWIGSDATLRCHAPSVRGCWPTVTAVV